MNKEQLQEKILTGIPLTQAMGFSIESLDSNHITVKAILENNINVHGTAFAGSLNNICTLALWGLVTTRLPENASLVLADSSIRYIKPVTADLAANCSIDEQTFSRFLKNLEIEGKARIDGFVSINNETGQAVHFRGTAYARLTQPTGA
jgi:thioesterase domain-containing protein